MSDFEKASRKSAHKKFPNIVVHGCYFHYTRAVFKNLLKIGLSKSYHKKPNFKFWAKLIMAMPLLPARFIPDMFTQLLAEEIAFENVADQLNFTRFKRYIEHTWVPIPAGVLSVFEMET